MGKSNIEWCTDVWNVTSGCSHSGMRGCDFCYAKEMHRRLSVMGQPKYSDPFDVVRCHPGELEKPLHWRKPRRVFVDSMSDLFHEDVAPDFIASVFGVMAATPKQTYQILTKRPGNMRAFVNTRLDEFRDGDMNTFCRHIASEAMGMGLMPEYGEPTPWPLPNVWLGYSASTQADLDKGIGDLLQTPALVRFLSCEPLLGPIDLSAYIGTAFDGGDTDSAYQYNAGVSWVIVGSESGPHRRECKPEWIESVVDQCDQACVPVFLKQMHDDNGRVIKMPNNIHGRVWDQMPNTSKINMEVD